ncbi:MAG: cytochrome P450 [Verrucomicrobiota bacterium]
MPPGPKRSYPGSLLLQFRRDPLGQLQKIAREFGDIVYLRLGRENVFLINHPDLIREVLVTQHHNFTKGRGLERIKKFLGEGLLTSEGETHLRQRRLMQPAFHHRRIAAFGEIMTAHAARTRDGWQDGATIDLAGEMMRLTLGIVGQTLFGANVAADAAAVESALATMMKSFSLMMLPFADFIEKLPLPAVRRMKAAHADLDAIIYRLIEERRRSGQDHGDLLSMLIAAQDEEDGGAGMTDQQVRDEAMTIFLAGHETTANALNWTWYLLAGHPAVEARLHAELDEVLQGRLPTMADLPALRFTENVVRESMRLYPPAWMVGRRAVADFPMGGYTVPARSIILMSQSVMHRDARYFPEPDQFAPDRWTPEFKTALPKYAYFPFGGGPRQCIGEGFAWMEAVLLLATLAQHWKLRLLPGHPVVPQPMVTLRPKHGLLMTAHRRHPAV